MSATLSSCRCFGADDDKALNENYMVLPELQSGNNELEAMPDMPTRQRFVFIPIHDGEIVEKIVLKKKNKPTKKLEAVK